MTPKNVAFIHYSCHPVIGGVEFVVEGQAKVMAKNGHRVRVLVGRGQEFAEGVQVSEVEEISPGGIVGAAVEKELARGEVTDSFRSRKDAIKSRLGQELVGEDVCIIHNVMTMHFDLALTAALQELIEELGGRVRFVVWCHDATLNEPHYALPKPTAYPWRLLSEHTERAAYVAISEERRRDISKVIGIPEGQMRVVPDGLDGKALLGISDHIWSLAVDLGLLGDTKAFLFPSRIVRRKNFELGVRIVSELKRIGMRCRLLITGPADPHNPATMDYYRELHELRSSLAVGEGVIFLHDIKDLYLPAGTVTFEDLRDLYAISDMLLITSTREGFCLPLLEAGAFKLPVACADAPPLPEVVEEDALLFGLEEDPKVIAERIARFLESNKSARLFKRVLGNYCWESVYEKHLKPLLE